MCLQSMCQWKLADSPAALNERLFLVLGIAFLILSLGFFAWGTAKGLHSDSLQSLGIDLASQQERSPHP